MGKNKGCGRMLAISSDRDCGVYCPFCKKVHYCVFCGGGYELHPVALKVMAEEEWNETLNEIYISLKEKGVIK